jgi:putative DNA primase/helicase
MLSRLAEIAARRSVAVVVVTHLNKGGNGRSAIYRATGSLAFIAAARMAWIVGACKDDPDRRLMVAAKNNLAPGVSGLSYRIEDGRVRWDAEPVNATADEVLAEAQDDGAGKLGTAMEFVRARLADGPMRTRELERLAHNEGIKKGTLERAKQEAGVKYKRVGFGAAGEWSAYLPLSETPPSFE